MNSWLIEYETQDNSLSLFGVKLYTFYGTYEECKEFAKEHANDRRFFIGKE